MTAKRGKKTEELKRTRGKRAVAPVGVAEPRQEQEAQPLGRPPKYKPEFAIVARGMAKYGATDFEIAEELEISTRTLWLWRAKYPAFVSALKEGKASFDDRVERSLAQRAVGYSYHSEKVFCSEGVVTIVPIVEHVPPDVGACKHWLANRRPKEWREKQEVELTGSEAFLAMWKAISAGAVPKSS